MTDQLLTRDGALAADLADPLAHTRDRFALPPRVVYLDGNSLGARPVGVAERLASVVGDEWGTDLIASWNTHHWMELPGRVGDRLGALVGAAPGQVVAADSTSVLIYKLLHAAAGLRPDRRVLVTEHDDFPTDRYLAHSVAAALGLQVRTVEPGALLAAIDGDVAAVCLTHVHFRTGRRHDLAAVSAAARAAGALSLWDLSHSAGAMPVALDEAGADLAVGCGYKFLNGGPGAPAFGYVAARHHEVLQQPITGWLGAAAPFAMAERFEPAPGIARLISGTPSVLALAALDAALDAFDGVDLHDLRAKSVALSERFIALLDARCDGHGIELLSPRDAGERASQVSFLHQHGYGIVRALAERGVVGDYREPGVCRFGLAPLYLRHVDVYDAVDALVEVLRSGAHLDHRWRVKATVT